MTESYTNPAFTNGGGGFPQAQGPFVSQAPPEDFSGDDVWKFTYNFGKYAKGKDVKGEVPVPTQARIDKYERDFTKIQVELEVASRQEQRAIAQMEEAHQGQGPTLEEAMAAVERTLALKAKAVDGLRDCLADFCGGHPTRKQFDLLPENALIAFSNAIRRKLNPNS